MIRCACGDKFDEHEEYELHQNFKRNTHVE